MVILILSRIFKPVIGGDAIFLDMLSRYLISRGHKVKVITFQPLTYTVAVRCPIIQRESGLEIYRAYFPLVRTLFPILSRKASKSLIASLALGSLIYLPIFIYTLFIVLKNRKEISVIHANEVPTGLIAAMFGKLIHRRSILTLHGTYDIDKSSFEAKLIGKIVNLVDLVMVLSERSRSEMESFGVSSTKLRKYRYWIDLNKFRPLNKEECKRSIGLEGKFTVLFAGKLVSRKGVKLIVELAKRMKDVHFIICGTGPLSEWIKREAKILPTLSFYGAIPNEKMPLYYNASDIVVVPSLYEEGWGRVVMEALACGVPVIASKRGALPELVNPKVGLVVEPLIENLLKAITFLKSSPDFLKKLRLESRKYALKYFSEKNAEIIYNAYFA